jgi:hypothetical protein
MLNVERALGSSSILPPLTDVSANQLAESSRGLFRQRNAHLLCVEQFRRPGSAESLRIFKEWAVLPEIFQTCFRTSLLFV